MVPIETLRFAQGDRSHTARGRIAKTNPLWVAISRTILPNEAKSARKYKDFLVTAGC